MKKQDPAKLLSSIGEKIIAYAKNELCMSARFLSSAAGYAEETDVKDLPATVPLTFLGTNGTLIVYNSEGLLRAYEEDPKKITRALAHLLFHCIYRHFAKAAVAENKLAWDVACDVAAEYLTDKLEIECVSDVFGSLSRENYYAMFKAKCPLLSAEYLYEELKFLHKLELEPIRKVFERDEHILWNAYGEGRKNPEEGRSDEDDNGEGEASSGTGEESETPIQTEGEGRYSFDAGAGALSIRGSDRESIKASEEDWKRIAERVKIEIENFSREYGTQTADLRRIINVELKTTYDYREFLRKFMVLKEIMKEDLSQFDYIYYNLGLTMYGNVPLYDHLEYALDYSLEDFVIAIDSSGSVFYDVAVNFLEECYSIVEQATSRRRRINLHVIQCDAAIKEDVLITGYDDFVRFIKRFTLKGGGGTDFRPVFARVDELIAEGKLKHLKGMIYFTDGRGKYPEKPPSYDVAFIFYGNKNNDYDVPPYAMKLVIGEDKQKNKR